MSLVRAHLSQRSLFCNLLFSTTLLLLGLSLSVIFLEHFDFADIVLAYFYEVAYAHCRRNGCWFCPNASDEELLHMITKHPELFDRLIEWEKEDNIFHRRLTRRETPSEVKARLLSKSQTGFSSPKSK